MSRKTFFNFSQIKDGIPKGALIEFSGASGSGKTSAVLKLLAENPGSRVAWIEEDFTIYPCSVEQSGVELSRVLFIEAQKRDELLWNAQQILRTSVFGFVVLQPSEPLDELVLRRLQLAAGKSRSSVILLSERPSNVGSWPISVQVEVNARELRVLKFRGERACG